MKAMCRFFAAPWLIGCSLFAHAETSKVNGRTWTYEISGGVATVTGVSPAIDELTIPSVLGGCPVRKIGSSAFFGCGAITQVTIPEGVASIGYNAFSECSGLEKLTMPDSVAAIGEYAFQECSSLKSVKLPKSLRRIEENCFWKCSALETIEIPFGVEYIGSSAFYACNALTFVEIPESVVEIGGCAFQCCSGLESVTIPDSVRDIGSAAFSCCTSLTKILMPNNLKRIESQLFSGCVSLASVIIPTNVTSIGSRAFAECNALGSFAIHEGINSIGADAFSNTKFWNDQDDGFVIVDGCLLGYKGECCGSLEIPDSVRLIAGGAFEGCNKLKGVSIPNSVTVIGGGAFDECSALESVNIPNSVTCIEGSVFGGCRGLRTITIPESVTNIGCFAFVNCSGLKSVTIPDGVEYLDDQAFKWCRGLADKDGFVIVGGTLYDYYGEATSITIPNGVKRIGYEAFNNLRNITSVSIPNGVTSIGYRSFGSCWGLSEVIIPDSVTNIEHLAFYDCRFVAISIPDSVQNIGANAFGEGWRLESVKLPKGLTSISEELFFNCDDLRSVSMPNSVTNIGKSAFSGCKELTSITIPDGMISIGGLAFCGCEKLTSIKIPNSVTSIGESAFQWCYGLLTVTIPECVTKLSDSFPDAYRKICKMTICDGVTRIAENAFEGCEGVVWVTMPSTVTNVGDHAFSSCVNVEEVVVPSGIVLKDVFPVANIASVTFADGVEYIESSCLAGLSVNTIVVPDSVTSIEDNALSVGRAITFKGECPDNYVYSGILAATSVTLPSKGSAAYMTYPKVSEILGVYALKGLSGESTPMTQVEGALYFNTTDHVDSHCAENTFKALSLSWIHRYYDHSGRFETSTNELENASAALHTQFWYSSNYRFTLRVPWCTSRDDEICLMATSDRFVGSTLDDVLDYMIPWLKCEVAEVKNLGDVDLNRGDIIAISAPAQSEVAILCDANEYPLDNYSSAERWADPADVGVALDGVYYWQVPDLIDDSKGEWEQWGEHREFPRYQGDGDQFFPIDFIICVEGEETSYEVQSYKDVASVTFDTGIHSQNGEIFKTYLSKGKSRELGLWQPFYICEDPWFDDWIEVHEEKWPSYWKQQQGGTVTPEWNSWASPETLASMSLEWGYGQPPPTHYEYHTAGWSVDPGWVFIGWRIVDGYWDSAPIESFDEGNVRSFPELQPTVRDAGVAGDDGIRFVAEYAPITNKIEYVDLKGCANSNPTNFTVLDEIEFSPLSDPKGWHFVGWNPARIEAGTVGDVVVTALWEVAISIPEAAGDISRQWKTHGDAEWYAAWSDERCDWFVRSGEIGDSQLTTLETCVTNAGLVSFDLRVSCEDWYRGVKTDGVTVAVDDEVRLVQGVCDWTNVCMRIEGEGEHIITWSYTKDVEGCGREDCACLANFVFAEEATLRFEGQSFCSGEPPEQIVTFVGESVEIPGSNTLSYDKHRFVGWQNGEAIYRAGDVCEIESTMLTFTAVWEAKILASPSISVQSYYETEKTLVTIVGDGNGDIYYTLDGSRPNAKSSRYVDPFEVAGSFTITAISLKDGWFESAAVVAKTQRAPWLIEECLNTTNLSLRTGGDAPWLRDLIQSHDEVASMRSGEISNTETSWIETTVEGSGAISFWWKGSTEKFRDTIFDVGTFEIDGDKKYEIGGETDWIFVSAKIDGSGSHTLRWQYTKDYEDDPGLVGECDCIWLDEVTWTPDAVALTLGDLAEVFGDDSDVAKNITDEAELAAFNGFLRDCSINSASDLKSAQKQYAYQSFKLSEITTAPRLFEEEPVLKIDDLELSGGNLSLTISLTAGAEAIQLAKDKLAEKIRVGSTLGDITGKPKITAHPAADGTSLTFTITPPEGDRGFVKVQID